MNFVTLSAYGIKRALLHLTSRKEPAQMLSVVFKVLFLVLPGDSRAFPPIISDTQFPNLLHMRL